MNITNIFGNVKIKKIYRKSISILVIIAVINILNITYVGYINNRFNLYPSKSKIYNVFSFWFDNIRPNTEKEVNVLETTFYQQKDYTCGVAALRYVLHYYGITISEDQLTELIGTDESGSTMEGMASAVSKLGLDGVGVFANYSYLSKVKKPVIAYVNDNHFIVVKKNLSGYIIIFDPSPNVGQVKIKSETFRRMWNGPLLIIKTKPIF